MKGLKELLEQADNALHGIAAAPGLYIGKAYIYSKESISVNDGFTEDAEEAIRMFREALERSKKELSKIFSLARKKMGETRATIFEAQLMILDDPVLITNIENRIKNEKRQPDYVVFDEISKYQELMIISNEAYMKERAMDIDDIKNRIIRNLQKKRWESKITMDMIVVSDQLTPADTILFSKRNVKGYVTNHGGLTSHAAIVARSLDIPAVVGTNKGTAIIKPNDELIVDGFHGFILVKPTEEQKTYFNEKIKHLSEINEELAELRNVPAKTTDGKEIQLMGNVDVSGEIAYVISNGAKGIGLYRTEQLIEEMSEFPDEEQQTEIYTKLATRIYPDQITIRVFDLGGDKVRLFHRTEANPFLGLRGIRFLLDNIGLYKSQLRAILRASTNKNIHIMIPMVSTLEEIHKTKALLEECKTELRNENIPFDNDIELGIMVEVPSAAILADLYADYVDFFSIGTNDLIQYIMAVDRGNDSVSNLYQEFHPAVLRTIDYIVQFAKKKNLCVSICGEMAADTLALPILVGLGLDSMSISPSAIPSAKRTIRAMSYEKAKALTKECMQMHSEHDILIRIEQFFADNLIERTRNIL